MCRGPFTPPSLYTPISAYTHPIIRPLPLSGQEGTFGEKWRGGRYKQGEGGGGGKSTAHTSYRDRRNRGGSWSRKNRTREGDHPSSPRSLGLFGWSLGGQVDRRRGPLSVIHRRSVLWLDPQRRREKMSSRDQIDNDAAIYYVRNIGDILHP